MPTLARSTAMASPISLGFGKYGRERDMYQNTNGSFLPSSQVIVDRPPPRPACFRRSCAFAGLYS